MYFLRGLFIILIFILGCCFSGSVFAGLVGEPPELRLYSQLDDQEADTQSQVLKRNLGKYANMSEFASGCPGAETLRGMRVTSEQLELIKNGNYGVLSREYTKSSSGGPVTIGSHMSLAACISERYDRMMTTSDREYTQMYELGQHGLYMDGDEGNSEYDIIADVQKINSIIFSIDLTYNGQKNKSLVAWKDFISGKSIPSVGSLLPSTGSDDTGSSEETESEASSFEGGSDTSASDPNMSEGGTSLASIIGATCGGDVSTGTGPVPIDELLDDKFLAELTETLGTPVTASATQKSFGETATAGYVKSTEVSTSATSNSSAQGGTKTDADDFFDTLPCDDVFCVKVSMVGGTQNLLGGGKNYSIEGILDKHSKILDKISNGSLSCEKMTSNFGSFGKSFKISDVISGARIYLAEKPQQAKKTPQSYSKEKAIEDARICAYASVGLSSDPIASNSFGSINYTSIRTTNNIGNVQNRIQNAGPQDVMDGDTSGADMCLQALKSQGKLTPYNSFSSDVNELNAFTESMIKEITQIIDLMNTLESKPTGC